MVKKLFTIRFPVRTRAAELFLVRRSRSEGIEPVSGEASGRRIEALKRPADQPQHSVRILNDRTTTSCGDAPAGSAFQERKRPVAGSSQRLRPSSVPAQRVP